MPSQPGARHHCNLVVPLSQSCRFQGQDILLWQDLSANARWVVVFPLRISYWPPGQEVFLILKVGLRFGIFF